MKKRVISIVTAAALLISMFTGIVPVNNVSAAGSLTAVSVDAVSVNTVPGTAPVLPSQVTVNYSESTTPSAVDVTWPAIDASKYAAEGKFTVEGDVKDTTIKAVATVNVTDAVVWYDFDEATGTKLSNLGTGGSAYDATTAVASTAATGHSGYALNCDGTNQYATIAKELTFGDNVTISAWVYSTDNTKQAMLYCFGAKTWMNEKSGQTGKLAAGMEPGWGQTSGAYNNVVTDSAAIPQGRWVHVAVTYEGTTAKLYRDGELVATKVLLNKPSDYNGSYTQNFIGRSATAWTADPKFQGYIDDFKIYNRALSAAEITSIVGVSHDNSNIKSLQSLTVNTIAGKAPVLPSTVTAEFPDGYTKSVDVTWSEITADKYATAGNTFTVEGTVTDSPVKAVATINVNAPVDANLIAWYKMDETSGTSVSDSSGNGNNAQMVGSGSWAAGKSGNAANLTGSNYIKLPDGIIQNVNDFTISVWEKQSTVKNWQRLLDFGNGLVTDSSFSYMYLCLNDGAKLRFSMNKNCSWQEVSESNAINDPNKWHHIAVTKTGSALKVYVDGVLYSQSNNITYNPSDIGKTTTTYIGKSQYPSDPNFAGLIDDFRIYSKGFSEEEVQSLIGEIISDDEAVAMNKASLDLGDTFALEKNLTLKTQGTVGVSIDWASSDEKYVSATGVISRPAKGEGTKVVTLTATLKKNSATDKKVFTVTLLEEGASPYSIKINTAGKGVDINPTLNGIFFEDINYSLDGGLYAELVQNRSFEFVRVSSFTSQTPDYMFAWNKIIPDNATGTIEVKSTGGIHANNPNYVSINVTKAGDGVGVYNTGYSNTAGTSPKPSIPLVQDDKYNFSMFARSSDYTGPVEVSLTNADGTVVYAKNEVNVTAGSGWKKLSCVLQPNSSSDQARLQVVVKGTGTVDLDMISLFPQRTWLGRENGVRYDLGKMLSDMKPKYLRFPGGCAVEGGTLENAYNWKLSIGPLEERKNNWNFWANSSNPDYNQSLGMGFYEYFQFAEDIGATPVPCINVGMSFTATSLADTTALQPYIDDAIDLIEFANGTDTSNKWVQKRIAMGHEKPFNMKYLEIGNENTGSDYYTRYQMFAEAINNYLASKGYSKIKLIVGGGITIGDGFYLTTWSNLQKGNVNADVVDEHYYVPNSTFYNNMNRYDNYDRNGQKVFIGEYASNSTASSMEDALAEAAYMTHIEENGDVVELASYAPLLAKQNFTQWTPDMIYFNNQMAYGTPTYYVQKLFMRNTGNITLPTELLKNGDSSHKIVGNIGFGSYNTAVSYKNVKITDNSTSNSGASLFSEDFSTDASKWTASTGTWSVNSGTYSQTSSNTANTLAYAGNITSDAYTVEFDARKDSGSEGFLIYMGLKDPKNYLRWNIGGYSNTKSGFERCVDGNTTQLVPYYDNAKFPSVTTGVWYNIKMVVSGNKVTCYIKENGAADYIKAFDIVDKPKTGPVYTISSKDTATGDIIVKVVNPQSTSQKVAIDLSGASYINPEGIKTVITAGDSKSANSFTNAENVVPVTTKITGLSSFNSMTFDPYSLTVLRIRTSETALPELSSVTVSTNKTTAKEGDTVRINIDGSKMNDSSNADLGGADITYGTDHPDLVTFDSDGKAVISNSTGSVASISLWANVNLDGVTVKSNVVNIALSKIAVKEVKEVFVSTVLNTQPKMPAEVFGTDVNGVTKSLAVTWPQITVEQLSKAGTFAVEGTIEGTDIKAIANVTVSSESIIKGIAPVNVTTTVNTAPSLPSKVSVQYTDGTAKEFDVNWDSIPADSLSKSGTVQVKGNFKLETYTNPLLEQRADPYIYRHTDGYYYFTASVPSYDKIILKRATTIQGLATAEEKTIWTAHSTGEMANHIWAPELHYINGRWYIYFAAGASTDQWAIRPYVLECNSADPMVAANWAEKGMIQAAANDSVSFRNFSLDATTFENNGKRYLVWAQKTSDSNNPSNLYIAEMLNPWTLKTKQVLISTPDHEWEKHTYWVDEGPSVIKRNGKIFISFSASATDQTYCMGLLTASDDSDLLSASSWSKASEPVMQTSAANDQYGPGHNTFTVAQDGVTDVLVYHTRDYTGFLPGMDALTDPNRHTRVKALTWNSDGTPNFGDPVKNGAVDINAAVTANVTVGEPAPADKAVTGVRLDQSTLTLTAGGATVKLTATVLPANATNKTVIWSSSDSKVATVANGTVTPVGAGIATITATTEDGNFSESCTVTVEAASNSGGVYIAPTTTDPIPKAPDTKVPDTKTPDTNTPGTPAKVFKDMGSHQWAQEAVEALAAKGIVSGTAENTFTPGKNITRADFITLLVKALDLKADFETNFEDVNSATYYYQAVGIAKQLGIASGTGGGKFNPKSEISRQDMMVLVAKALKAANKLKNADSSALDKYTDSDSISGYAEEAVAALVSDGIIAGSNGKINPFGKTTRAEAAVIIYKIFKK